MLKDSKAKTNVRSRSLEDETACKPMAEICVQMGTLYPRRVV